MTKPEATFSMNMDHMKTQYEKYISLNKTELLNGLIRWIDDRNSD